MKRILINATQNEEIRVALCKGNHLYDFDLENRTREQKKSNIYKGHVTRVEPSLEAVFVEYGSQRQGFLPIREISAEYLSGNPRDENIKKLIKEGDELIVQVEKEERGNKGAALSTYVSLAGRYLVLMPNNPRGGGISRQISGKLREDMKRMLGNLDLAKGMSVIIRTAGIGKTQEDLQHDLNHLLNIWQAIQEQNQKYPSPRLVHQEAGVVTRAVRDYLRDDIAEIWIDNENAYVEAAGFIDAVMPTQADKLRKYTDYEPMFARFNIEKQIETAYQREVRLPSGGSIVIDQTEALVSIDINSAKSTKGSDVAETAYHTNLEAADEIARQLRLRDMGGLIVIDFIDMNDNKHQKEVEKRLVDATKYDRARVQFGDISKFGLMEMSRQRLRPSLEESTGYICPRCHGNGMIRDLRSLSLSIMREIEQIALKERQGEVQAEVPTDIAAFLLNEKRDSIVYLEQDSGTRITILPHAHLESPNFKLHFNRDGFAPSSYERITDTQQEHSGLGYDVDWQTAEKERPEQQPTRQPRKAPDNTNSPQSSPQNARQNGSNESHTQNSNEQNSANRNSNAPTTSTRAVQNTPVQNTPTPSNVNQNNTAQVNTQNAQQVPVAAQSAAPTAQPQAVAWLSNLFAQAPQAQTSASVSSRDAAEAIEALVNTGAQSLGSFGQVDNQALSSAQTVSAPQTSQPQSRQLDNSPQSENNTNRQTNSRHTDSSVDNHANDDSNGDDRRRRQPRKPRPSKPHQRKDQRDENGHRDNSKTDNGDINNAAKNNVNDSTNANNVDKQSESQDKREHDNKRSNDNARSRNNRQENGSSSERSDPSHNRSQDSATEEQTRSKRKPHSQRSSRGKLERNETLTATTDTSAKQQTSQDNVSHASTTNNSQASTVRHQDPNEVTIQVNEARPKLKAPEVVHLSLDDSKSEKIVTKQAEEHATKPHLSTNDALKNSEEDSAAQHSEENSITETVNESIDHTPAVIDTVSTTEDEALSNAYEVSKASDSQEAGQIDGQIDDKTTDSETAVDTLQSSESIISAQEPVVAKAATTSESTATVEQKTADSNDTTVAPTDNMVISIENNGTTHTKNNEAKDSNVTDSSAALELTHAALFAKRYVTANKFGQASNDPRVVRQQQDQLQATLTVPTTEPVIQKTTANSLAIRGTVGEFIHATLADAQSRLADDGVIRSFIDAITVHTQQTADTDGKAITDDVKGSENNASDAHESSFNFSNYGYEPLAADYLTRFGAMTQAVSQFAAAQGKTAVDPRAIGERASNDPRGQHPDYHAPVVLEATTVSEPTVASQDAETKSNSRYESTNTQEMSNVVNSDINSDVTQSEIVANDSQVESSDMVSTDSERLDIEDRQPTDDAENPLAETNQVDVHDIEATALTGEMQADDVSAESKQSLQADQLYLDNVQLDSSEPNDAEGDDAEVANSDMIVTDSDMVKAESVKDDSQAGKSKTTIASYKNMIESVAEQLLQQTGSFNLTTPKVPKSRTRKPKTDHKKPTQAENIESDNSDSDGE
ncbi:Rne/Rng family ribonuclease [Psychrobacter frigidicola]|uniref:Ribonuclease E n=1 Tax=Psychrobacter frigidicola TaxID=45611 RepID=A0A5C7A372_9GAMM|nr:Rne/Rng family ribonuclease [Psychrobacter frigidicola]TXD97032.1 Rne/Rng family ribonuclease [Psychrobacter frigidicola]